MYIVGISIIGNELGEICAMRNGPRGKGNYSKRRGKKMSGDVCCEIDIAG